MASHPTSKKRSHRQKVKDRYAHAREDAQLAGLIPTTPEEALKSERVNPLIQDEQRFPGLDRQAIRNDGHGWSVPEHVKRKVIEKTAEVLFAAPEVVIEDDGSETEVPPDAQLQMQAAKTLMMADKQQWERDAPEEAGMAAGANQVVSGVEMLGQLLQAAKMQREISHEVEVTKVSNDGDAVQSGNTP